MISVVQDELNRIFICALSQISTEEYWKKELWRKLKKYKNYRTMEINTMIYISNLNAQGYWYRPLGSSWASPTSNHKEVLDYLEEFDDLSLDYKKWYESQR